VLAGKLTWTEAADIAGVSYRNMERMRQQYCAFGYDGIFVQKNGKRHRCVVPFEIVVKVLTLYQRQYLDCDLHDFHGRLRDECGVQVDYSWLVQALEGAGLRSAPKVRTAD
jgi:hypothetical protein